MFVPSELHPPTNAPAYASLPRPFGGFPDVPGCSNNPSVGIAPVLTAPCAFKTFKRYPVANVGRGLRVPRSYQTKLPPQFTLSNTAAIAHGPGSLINILELQYSSVSAGATAKFGMSLARSATDIQTPPYSGCPISPSTVNILFLFIFYLMWHLFTVFFLCSDFLGQLSCNPTSILPSIVNQTMGGQK